MAKQYQVKLWTNIESYVPANSHLTTGATAGQYDDWMTLNVDNPPITVAKGYYFHDANNMVNGEYTDANATRVLVMIEQTWSTSVDTYNNLTVTLSTSIGPIVRDNKQGVCDNLPARTMLFFTQDLSQQQPRIIIYDDQVGTERTLDSNVYTETTTFVIPPLSGGNEEPSVTVVDTTATPEQWTDVIWMGAQFRNILPPDYRPGATRDNSVWQSHNRPTGNSHVYDGTKFLEMRTIGAPTEMGIPPSILHDNKWYNMNKIGKDADA